MGSSVEVCSLAYSNDSCLPTPCRVCTTSGRDGAPRLSQSGGARGDDQRWKAMVSHTSPSFQPEHRNKMQWGFVFAAVVAVVSGHRVSYDGTPLADNVVLIG
ncbi:hypothetical protein GWK47_048208 [Chionoecetes opilio]|uniref:Uncharacterized protein n=1 Tax=Chionoecetes opilio TaxID=41210 RepID=A0A8J4YAI5_CHIOP|nr:hypothetical protein GWK47_048208 [Chionoecetes opilio]